VRTAGAAATKAPPPGFPAKQYKYFPPQDFPVREENGETKEKDVVIESFLDPEDL
jgi:hypothetical protein